MSRPRSRSPHYRKFPWEAPEFHPHKGLEELLGSPRDRSHHHREGPEEHRSSFRGGVYPEDRRRSPPFPDDLQFDRHHPELYLERLSPRHDTMRYENQRLSPPKEGAFDMDRRRGGFREYFQRFEDRSRREPGMSWRREEQGRGWGRFRDSSPSVRYGDHQRAGERGRRTGQGPSRGRQRENPHQERATSFQRTRREMDDADHLGFRDEKELVHTARGGFGGGAQGKFPRGDFRHSGSHFSKHDHGAVDNREVPQWQQFEDRRLYEPGFDRQRSPHSVGSSQERFRTSGSRLDGQEDTQGLHYHDMTDLSFHETRRSPVLQERPHAMRYGDRDGPMNHKRRGGPRRGYSQSPGGRTHSPRNQSHLQETPQGYQDLPHEEQRPFPEEFHGPMEDQLGWAEEDRLKQWEHDRPEQLDQFHKMDDMNPKIPRQREHEWSDQQASSMTVVTEETLTIKVDMSRPVNQNSPLCYSSDRQLSLDLVNVGRQRLDFLPMLKHSGTYRETDMHTGTFAQEIITLVHLVKDQYFRGAGVTLNERFSAPQAGGFPEEETEELTLNQRFSSNRGFSLDSDLLLGQDESIFSRLGLIQGLSNHPLRGPGDLRHDLERRRQERLEGVKVTIQGSGLAPPPLSEPETMSHLDHEDVPHWPEEQHRRWERSTGLRRGPSNRGNFGAQRRNNRFANRRQNLHSNPAGADW